MRFLVNFAKFLKNIPFYWPTLVAPSVCHKTQNLGVNKFPAIFIHNVLE